MEYSLQDLIAIGMPYMIILGLPLISGCFIYDPTMKLLIYDPTMKLLIYALIPDSPKSWLWFWPCFAIEIHFLIIFMAVFIPGWQLQVISFDLVNTKLEAIMSCRPKR